MFAVVKAYERVWDVKKRSLEDIYYKTMTRWVDILFAKIETIFLSWNFRLFGCFKQDIPQRLFKKTFFSQIHYEFVYDPVTQSAVREENGAQQSFQFPGVFLWENFVSEDEERELVAAMDENVWRQSQSGRRKQVAYCKQAGIDQTL